ncbi:vWA domain-containing protein [Alicyclobacillus fastidiosus]|uniref:VWA domain-containing protein n=1 Tax=Alicyclobacillus fastidiosus TaxID=392011 RepID=A0ABV5AE21_9BACL|nr:vWA domain-containing protein [Alicyclobacillus fastidiosus]WEH09947.1 VWA domain-containing protein [Alicyclobacillus fastidiosus]
MGSLSKEAMIRQILVITDGYSNIGEDPITCAAEAHRQGIVVNVIGVVDKGEMGDQGHDEAMSIADAGGGMCRIVHPVDLSATAQMMTHQTMQMTLQQVVNQELQSVIGKTTEELPPTERSRVMQVVDKLEEEVGLHLVVAIDTSASMKDKIPTVREAVRDLALSLQVRLGTSRVAVVSFPGHGEESTKLIQDFSDQVDMKELETSLQARGGTPTGPAIRHAISLIKNVRNYPRPDEYDGPRRDYA